MKFKRIGSILFWHPDCPTEESLISWLTEHNIHTEADLKAFLS